MDTHRYDNHHLPLDIDQHMFTKFTNVYFRSHVWGMKREPIKTPFLVKANEKDYQESLAIFKLVSLIYFQLSFFGSEIIFIIISY